MKKGTIIIGFFFVVLCGLLIVFSPDALSMMFVILQTIMMLLGFVFGIFRVSRFDSALQYGRAEIIRTKREIQTDNLWTALARNDRVFFIDALDRDFATYKESVASKKKDENSILPDIEDVINEDTISLKIWRGAVNQIPETLTSIGILGTFVGLIIGVGSIGFSSVTAAVTSLQTLINGIEIAFYTSIAGIILSIIFNLVYKLYWNMLLRNLSLFIDEFHKSVIPSEDTQMKTLQVKYYSTMLERFKGSEDIPRG